MKIRISELRKIIREETRSLREGRVADMCRDEGLSDAECEQVQELVDSGETYASAFEEVTGDIPRVTGDVADEYPRTPDAIRHRQFTDKWGAGSGAHRQWMGCRR